MGRTDRKNDGSSSDDVTAPSVANLFKGKNFAFIATLMEDGSPQVTPTWVDLEGNTILINTAEGRLKQRNTARDPRVAVSVINQNNPYEMVAVQGRVVEQTTDGADKHIDRLASKYLGVDKYPNRAPGEKRVILKIEPEKVFQTKPPR